MPIIDRNRRIMARASDTGLPITAWVIIDADDCEIHGLEIYGDGPTVKAGADGVGILGDQGYIHDCYIHDLYSRAITLRGADCVAERIIARRCRKDMVTCKSRNSINCIIRDCSAGNGGAIYADELAAPLIDNCLLVGNEAVRSGGCGRPFAVRVRQRTAL